MILCGTGRGVVLLAGLFWCAGASPLVGQESHGNERPSRLEFTGPALEPGHWAVQVARRLEESGNTSVFLPAQNAVPLEEVDRVLRDAAGGDSSRVQQVAAAWHARLVEEYGGVLAAGDDSGPPAVLLGRRIGVGFTAREGVAAPGLGEFEPDRTGAIPLEDRTRVVGVAEASAGVGDHVGLGLRVEADGGDVRVERLELAAGWGRWRASAGRAPVGYGPGRGGGVLLSGGPALDAIRLGTRQPVRLPWLLRVVGPVSLHTFMGRMFEARHPGDPFVWGASVQMQPHRRTTFGIHRAAFFGGRSDQPVTVGRLVDMLIGRVAGIGFEDQIVSVSGRYRLPTESVVPLTAYLEWGAEDAAGAWFDVPAIVAGLRSPSLPFAPAAELGVEYAYFGTSCCGNPEWYRHWSFPGAWASRSETLGHPLGGNGSQATGYASAYLSDARYRMEAAAYRRDRQAENLFVPGRAGVSYGVTAGLAARFTPSWELRFAGELEEGSGWTTSNLRIEINHF